MFNFLDPKLMPKVICNCASMENYEAENLINPNEAIKARGFIAYSVIKPPVDLEFEFICPIDICYIDLQTCIGLQKCSGIEIFAKNSYNPAYISIAKAIYDKNSIVFCNSRRYSREKPPPFFKSDEKSLAFFRSDKFRLFTDVSAIKIMIFRTERRSVPCISSAKVYGNPSKACSEITVKTINKLMGINASKTVLNENNKQPEDLKVPDDFLDDLTFEIMAVPMTLPSGQTIDRETLDKHIKNEKSYGRQPGDPFTGLKFTETRKPILNAALKSRIDMYFMQNADNPRFYGIKRTVGSSFVDGSDVNKKKKIVNGEKCSICDENDVLYVLPCKHFYCKPCLLNLNNQCKVCCSVFCRSDAERCYS